MTAHASSAVVSGSSGLRPVDPRRDMATIADLIEGVFAEQLDAPGRRLVREMRALGRLGWAGWLIAQAVLPPAARPLGFVWEESGTLVGNASLMGVQGHPGRWVLANVAVAEAFRRRGIGSALVDACLAWAGEHGGRRLMLQVRSDNHWAIALYRRKGFRPVCARTVWRHERDKLVTPAPRAPVRRRRPEEWRQQWALAERLHPEGLIWPFPLDQRLFRPTGLSARWGLSQRAHWVWQEQGRLMGTVMAKARQDQAGWRLFLLVEPEAQARIEGPLLEHALAALGARRGPITLEYPQGLAEKELAGAGFREKRRLTWMAADLRVGSPLE